MVYYLIAIIGGFMVLNRNLIEHHKKIEYRLDRIQERLNKRNSDDS